jgi:hypothetical protein
MWSGELRDITGYYDSHTATATTTLTSCGHYTIKESYERGDTLASQTILSLEDVMMASSSRMHSKLNEFLTGEFGWANLPLIRDVLQGLRIVPTPRCIVEFARNERTDHNGSRTLIRAISPHRSWRKALRYTIAPGPLRVTGHHVDTPNTSSDDDS